MRFKQKHLDELWDLVKDKRCSFWGDYIGLREVHFNLNIVDFIYRNHLKHKQSFHDSMDTSAVFRNLEQMIELLREKDIRAHHLSCAATTKSGNNSAFCVHYIEEDKIYVATIPGINYVPTEETRKKFEDAGI